jgi:hypothetical protein
MLPAASPADTRVITFTNGNHDYQVAGYRYAQQTGYHNRRYGDYGPVQPFPKVLDPGDSGTVTLPDHLEYYDVQYVDSQGRVIHRQEAGLNQYLDSTPAAPNLGVDKVLLRNIADREWRVYFARPRKPDDWEPGTDYYGGPLIPASDPLGWEDEKTIYLPRGGSVVNVIAVDQEDTMAFRQFIWSGDGWRPEILDFESDESVPFVMTNREENRVGDIFVYRYQEDQDPTSSHPPAVDLLEFTPKSSLLKDESVTVHLEPGRYHFKAVTWDGVEIDYYVEVAVPGDSWDIRECEPPGSVRNGTQKWPLQKLQGPDQATSQQSFENYQASGAAVAGPLAIDLCTKSGQATQQWTVGAGQVLIDPDGYVYEAALGVSAVIAGATVTCDLYDEDMLAWERWPAELYESQINPQVTAEDGYYAFFVPPGLYRVRAEAAGFLPHTSPDIRVIREIVHYNVPLQREAGYFIHLPVVLRNH